MWGRARAADQRPSRTKRSPTPGAPHTVIVYPKAGNRASRVAVLLAIAVAVYLSFQAGKTAQKQVDDTRSAAITKMLEHENEVLDDIFSTMTDLKEPIRFPQDTLMRCM